jgi:hypothetical protein
LARYLTVIYIVLRIEWLWSLARKQRWEEEVDHLQEEMRRFVQSASHCFQKWMVRKSTRLDVTSTHSDGLHAYAYRQSFIIAYQAILASRLWNLPTSLLSWIPHEIERLAHDFGNDAIEWRCEDNVKHICDSDDEGLGMDDIQEDYASDDE